MANRIFLTEKGQLARRADTDYGLAGDESIDALRRGTNDTANHAQERSQDHVPASAEEIGETLKSCQYHCFFCQKCSKKHIRPTISNKMPVVSV